MLNWATSPHLCSPQPLQRRSVFLTLQNPVFHPISVSFREWFAPAREWSTFSKTGSRKSSFFGVDFGSYLSTVSRKHFLVLKLLWILGRFFSGRFSGRFWPICDDSIGESHFSSETCVLFFCRFPSIFDYSIEEFLN